MIRLQRVGRKNHAEFRLVATEKTRAAKSSNYVEHLGHYNPHTDSVSFNTERVLYWIEQGAQVSDTVHNLLVGENVIKGKKRNVLPNKSPIVKDEVEEESNTDKAEVSVDKEKTEKDDEVISEDSKQKTEKKEEQTEEEIKKEK